MLISVLLQSTAATPPSPPPLCITVHHRDTITDIHVESVISSLKLQFSKLDSFNADFNVYDGPPNLKAYLGKVAPPDLFSMAVPGQRSFSDELPNKSWVNLGILTPRRMKTVPFPFSHALSRLGIKLSEVESAKYLAR